MLNKEENLNHQERTTQQGSSFDFAKTVHNRQIVKEQSDIFECVRLEADIRSDGKSFKTVSVLKEDKTDRQPFLINKTSLEEKLKHYLNEESVKVIENKVTYLGLLKHLFPEIGGIPSLNIAVMDSIFYNSDGSLCYICTDSKKGLIKTKCKNYSEIFLKRKAELDHSATSKKHFRDSLFSEQSQQNYNFSKYLNYVALLRYKDETFIRLKQAQFKSIFLRPVQANERYRFVGNTQYIQILPTEVLVKEKTLHQIQFKLDEHKLTPFFIQAIQKHAEETSYIHNSRSQQYKQGLKQNSPKLFMLYTIFQMFAYINIHYHKHLIYGNFQFMEVSGEFYLSNVRKSVLIQTPMIRSEYQRSPLINGKQEQQDFEVQDLISLESGVGTVMQNLFQRENMKICTNIRNFVKRKFEEVENQPDIQESCSIFSSINQDWDKNFHEVLQDECLYTKFLNKKKKQLDGFSPLTSISNIARKKHQICSRNFRFSLKKKENLDNQCNIKGVKKEKFKALHFTPSKKPKQKWQKKQFNSRQSYF